MARSGPVPPLRGESVFGVNGAVCWRLPFESVFHRDTGRLGMGNVKHHFAYYISCATYISIPLFFCSSTLVIWSLVLPFRELHYL